jgi:glycosyltransferase involved in cell wall biosynthesis
LYIGRLEERKGVMTLLQALKIVAEKDPEVSLTLAGANLMGDSIITFLKEHRLENRVHMTGRISDQQMIELLSSEGILIVPSLLEGFGLIAAEGMAAGIPVLVSDSPGLRSIVKDRETGYLFRSSDAEDLARVLQEMVHDGSINSVARRAREEALVRFDPAKQAGETIRVYQVEKSEGRSQKAE